MVIRGSIGLRPAVDMTEAMWFNDPMNKQSFSKYT